MNKKNYYTLQPAGQIVLSCGEQSISDPTLEKFLVLLAQDMTDNLQAIQPISSVLVHRAQSLVAGIEVDLNAVLLDEDE